MAKIRHIAIRSEDVDGTARFFEEVFGLEVVLRRDSGAVDLSDGDLNITLLPMSIVVPGWTPKPGFEHIGFTVEDEEETRRKLEAHGAKEMPRIPLGDVYYEAKYLSAEGLIVDVGHWAGTSPIPEAAPEPASAGAGS
jgi:catechol 2,3-dioxygenase-like lactoylglutathione lyase family enzyme